MHNKHILKWVLSSVAVLSVATVLVYNNSDYDSNVTKSEPKSDNLVPNVSAESHAKLESKDSHNDLVEVSQTSRYEDLVSNFENSVLRPVVEKPVEKPVEQPKVEKQVEQPRVEKPVEQPKVEKPEYTAPIGIPGTPEVHEKPELVIPEVPNKPVEPSKPVQVENKPLVQENMLPNTGGGDSSILSILGGLSLTSLLGFVSRKRKED